MTPTTTGHALWAARLSRFFACLIGLGLITGAGCRRAVDVEPRFNIPTEEALSTTANLEAAVNGAYSALQRGPAMGGGYKLISDILSETVQQNPDAYARGQLSYFEVYQRNQLQSASAGGTWGDSYRAIESANNVIEAIETGRVKVQDRFYLANRDRLLGEALFVRATAHFELVRLYGLPFGVDSDRPQSGVVLRLIPARNRQGQLRATVREVYTQCEQDLRRAATLLPGAFESRSEFPPTYGGRAGGRATREAAHGYLARLFFQKGTAVDNDSAAARATLALGAGPGSEGAYSPAADQIVSFTEHYFLKRGAQAANQTLFQIVNAQNPVTLEINSTSAAIQNAYSSPTDFDPNNPTVGIPPIYVGSRLFFREVLSALDGADRRSRFYARRLNGELAIVFKWYRIAGQQAVINIPVLRSPELLLTRAEVNAWRGNLADAITDVNLVRAAAEAPPLSAALTQEQLLAAIRKERMIELAFEGDRLHDWRRRCQLELNLTGQITIERELMPTGVVGNQGQMVNDFRLYPTVRHTDRVLLFQLPESEFFNNPGVERN